MRTYLFPALKITSITVLIFGVIYPLFITGVAYVVAPNHGRGETIEKNGTIVGFSVIGQSFDSAGYFNSRPSAVGYNAAATGGSNKGTSNAEYLAQVEDRISTIMKDNPGLKRSDIPVDLVTASGGGLDPDISLAAARIQVQRISRVRNIPAGAINGLINEFTNGPTFGLFGPTSVNVLKLNIALDEIKE